MPIIKSAKKALRQNLKRRVVNRIAKDKLKLEIKKLKESKTVENLAAIYSLADKATKNGIIHKNKANRLKSRLALFAASLKNKGSKHSADTSSKKALKKG